MKTIVAGTRTITDYDLVARSIEGLRWKPTEIVGGGAKGVDALGAEWAMNNMIPFKEFPADWVAHGRAAGPIRNAEMAEYAHALLAIWDGKSAGTRDMISQAKKRKLAVEIVVVKPGGLSLRVWLDL